MRLRAARGLVQRVAQQRVALGVDDDGAVAVLDEPGGDPRLRDGLARAGGADDERVLPARLADRDVHGGALRLAADDQATLSDPMAVVDVASLAGSAQGIEGSEPAAGARRPGRPRRAGHRHASATRRQCTVAAKINATSEAPWSIGQTPTPGSSAGVAP